MKRASRVSKLVIAVLGLFSMAPTAGDVGGCGSEITALDLRAFALARKDMDCGRCRECGIQTARCERSCDPESAPETSLPSTCQPLQHDGRVCLRALSAASCGDYASYVDDLSPSTPSECEFCRIAPEEPAGAFAADASSREGAP